MVLSDREIVDFRKKGEIYLDPFDKDSLQPASYDFKVGAEAFVNGKIIDLREEKYIKIRRGSFAVLVTLEKIRCGTSVAGKFGLRSYFARKGLVLLSGIQIDPGYEGTLTAFVFNLGPEDIIIKYEQTFATVEFSRIRKRPSHGYDGPYQGSVGIPLEDLESLVRPRPPMSLEEIQDTLTRLEDRYRLLGRLTYVIIGAMVTLFVTLITFTFYVINLLLPMLHN